jgi:hypothetical protein
MPDLMPKASCQQKSDSSAASHNRIARSRAMAELNSMVIAFCCFPYSSDGQYSVIATPLGELPLASARCGDGSCKSRRQKAQF